MLGVTLVIRAYFWMSKSLLCYVVCMINKIIIKGNGQQQILVPEGAQLVRLPGGQMQIIQGGAGQILQQAQTGQNQVILVSRNNAQVSSPSNKQDTTPNKVTER